MSRETTCCFTGHRPSKLPWKYNESDPRCIALKQKIYDSAEALYADGIRNFICGMAMGCDIYFGEAILELRKSHPDITLEAAIPCGDQSEGWSYDIVKRYEYIRRNADTETVLQEKFSWGCMNKRNRYMVDNSSFIIAVFDGTSGGTKRTMDYAETKGLVVILITP